MASANPFVAPLIDPNYLADPRDVDTLIAGCKIASKLVTDCSAMSDIAAFAPAHPMLVEHVDKGTDVIADDAVLELMVRALALTLYHPTSTCRIGDVVDPSLRVFMGHLA